jgi:hypothetical protein
LSVDSHGSHLAELLLFTVQGIAAKGMNKVLDELNLDALILPSSCWLATAFPCISG